MIGKPVRSSVVALSVGAMLCGSAAAQTQYQHYAPYRSQYAQAQPQYQQQQYEQYYQQYYQQYDQQQGAPAQQQQYQQQQYAPAAQQYAPAQAAAYTPLPDYCNVNNAAVGVAGG